MTLPTAALALAYSPGSWSTSFTLTGTAAATLTGLFFVARSLRVRDLRQSVMFTPRARYLLLWLIVITVGSAFVVMPGQSPAVLGRRALVWLVGCAVYDLVGALGGSVGAACVLSRSGRAVAWHGGDLAAQPRGRDQPARRVRRRAVPAGVRGAARDRLEVAAAWSLIVGIGKDIMPGRQRKRRIPRCT
jgi:hypothetical protein